MANSITIERIRRPATLALSIIAMLTLIACSTYDYKAQMIIELENIRLEDIDRTEAILRENRRSQHKQEELTALVSIAIDDPAPWISTDPTNSARKIKSEAYTIIHDALTSKHFKDSNLANRILLRSFAESDSGGSIRQTRRKTFALATDQDLLVKSALDFQTNEKNCALGANPRDCDEYGEAMGAIFSNSHRLEVFEKAYRMRRAQLAIQALCRIHNRRTLEAIEKVVSVPNEAQLLRDLLSNLRSQMGNLTDAPISDLSSECEIALYDLTYYSQKRKREVTVKNIVLTFKLSIPGTESCTVQHGITNNKFPERLDEGTGFIYASSSTKLFSRCLQHLALYQAVRR